MLTVITPFALCLGRQARLPVQSSISSLPEMELATNYAKTLALTISQTKEIVDGEITAAQALQQTGYNRHHATQSHGFKKKKWVLLYHQAVKTGTVFKTMCKISLSI